MVTHLSEHNMILKLLNVVLSLRTKLALLPILAQIFHPKRYASMRKACVLKCSDSSCQPPFIASKNLASPQPSHSLFQGISLKALLSTFYVMLQDVFLPGF